MTQAHPLSWPSGYPRTFQPKTAQFKVSLADSRDHLLDEIRQLGGTAVVISSNAVLLKNGLPAAKQPKLHDVGVAVYFLFNKEQVVLPCDKWDDMAANLRAIGLTVNAMRGMERWGVGDMLKRAFYGFKALPSPADHAQPEVVMVTPVPDWKKVLKLRGVITWDAVQEAYKKRRRETHPDAGGSHEEFTAVQAAYEDAKKKFGFK